MTKLLTLGVAATIVLCISTQVYALCPNSQPAQNFGGRIVNCPDAKPVAGYVGVVGTPFSTNNSAGIDVICEDSSVNNGQSVQCQAEAGQPNDGNVTISYNWGSQPPPWGCPNTAGAPGVGRNYFEIVCNNGAGAFITVAYDIGTTGYDVDFAHPYNPADRTFDLALGTDQTGLKLASFNRGTPTAGQDTACIDQTTALPHIYSDCDPGSLAIAFGVPCLDTTPIVAPGPNIYLATGPAGSKPTDLRTFRACSGSLSANPPVFGKPCAIDTDCNATGFPGTCGPVPVWTAATTTAGPNNSKCVTYPTPTGNNCTWIGSTTVIGGADTGAINGWVEVCAGPPAASTDKVKINSASFNQGNLNVSFSTENETLIVGFNVYAGSTKLNTGLIAAKGTGSNAYPFEVGRGAVKSNRTVTVEAVKSDGTVVKTAPANLK